MFWMFGGKLRFLRSGAGGAFFLSDLWQTKKTTSFLIWKAETRQTLRCFFLAWRCVCRRQKCLGIIHYDKHNLKKIIQLLKSQNFFTFWLFVSDWPKKKKKKNTPNTLNKQTNEKKKSYINAQISICSSFHPLRKISPAMAAAHESTRGQVGSAQHPSHLCLH